MTKPVRIQRSRKAGYNMQEHSRSVNGLDCVYVGRPTKWGNPFCFDQYGRRLSIFNYKNHLTGMIQIGALDKAEIMNKNLVCWCPPDKPCHADVLLELANK